MPGTLMPMFTSFANPFDINNYITFPKQPAGYVHPFDAAGVPPEWQPRRLWSEALRNYWPHFLRGTIKTAKKA